MEHVQVREGVDYWKLGEEPSLEEFQEAERAREELQRREAGGALSKDDDEDSAPAVFLVTESSCAHRLSPSYVYVLLC